jgi:aminoglycoside phosphotransferase family enzyme/predicted kinase
MDTTHLIDQLSLPRAYPYPVEQIEVRQTHISVVFLAGPFVYKVKKAINLGFVNFTELASRRHFCKEEVRLNRRLAPGVYLAVVPVTSTEEGLSFEGAGKAIDWAVKMTRLPEEATLQKKVIRHEIDTPVVWRLAQRVAQFHREADRNQGIATFGRHEMVAANVRENFVQSQGHIGQTVSETVFSRVQSLSESALQGHQLLIDDRAAQGMPCDTHGDLHLDHVYLFPDRPPPNDLIIVDCIEFSERFRFADPVADMAFMVMDFAFHGRRDLAKEFAEAYFRESRDDEGRQLLPFYAAYRSLVRAKVEGMKALAGEVPDANRQRARLKAQARWLLALAELAPPSEKPCMVLIGGLPGTGKSTLAAKLAQAGNYKLIRSDVIRKELAATLHAAAAHEDNDIYSAEWTEHTYAECLRRSEAELLQGNRVIVDANFWEENKRQQFLNAGCKLGVAVVLLHCRAEESTIRRRIAGRHGDASDANWNIYEKVKKRWQEFEPPTRAMTREVNTTGTSMETVTQAGEALRQLGLLDEEAPF